MLYFWKAEGSRMSNMTFSCVNPIQLGPSPFNSSPQCKKSSLRHHFRRNSWKLCSQKLLPHGHFFGVIGSAQVGSLAQNMPLGPLLMLVAVTFVNPIFRNFAWNDDVKSFLPYGDELNGLGPSWMGLTSLNPKLSKKYSIHWVFQAFFYVFCTSTKTIVYGSGVVVTNSSQLNEWDAFDHLFICRKNIQT